MIYRLANWKAAVCLAMGLYASALCASGPLNKTLLAFASYNAGPNPIALVRQRAQREGLDPNKWLDNV